MKNLMKSFRAVMVLGVVLGTLLVTVPIGNPAQSQETLDGYCGPLRSNQTGDKYCCDDTNNEDCFAKSKCP